MTHDILKLVPREFKCPYCGKWHPMPFDEPLENYTIDNPLELVCSDIPLTKFDREPYLVFYFDDHYIHIRISQTCYNVDDSLNATIPWTLIFEYKPKFTFDALFSMTKMYLNTFCSTCLEYNHCNYHDLSTGALDQRIDQRIFFGFMFDEDEFKKVCNIRSKTLDEDENKENVSEVFGSESIKKDSSLTQKDEELVREKKQLSQKVKEDLTMKGKASKLWGQIYEHSPKENVDIAKRWIEKYKPTLKWAVPVVSIYAAYKILNSKNSPLCVENIDKVCQEKLGFKLDFLENKQKLNELMALGKVAALAYGAIKVASSIYGNNEELADISAKQIEEDMDNLDKARKKYGWIQPKTEAMLPVALSVITVYVMTQKPAWFESVQKKVSSFTGRFGASISVYWDMLKLFIADKFNIDLNTEEDKQKAMKFAFLGLILAVGTFLYGKKILVKLNVDKDTEDIHACDISPAVDDEDSDDNGIKVFMSQILVIMKKLLPVAFASAGAVLVAKKINSSDEDDIFDVEACEVPDSEDESNSDESDFEKEEYGEQ